MRESLPPEWLAAIRKAMVPPRPPRTSDPPGQVDRLQEEELRALVEQLRFARIAGKLTQTDVARAVGISRSAVAKIESGDRRNPTFAVLYRFAWAVGLHLTLVAEPLPPDDTSGI